MKRMMKWFGINKMNMALLTLKCQNGHGLYICAFEQVLVKDITRKSSSEEVTVKQLKAKQFNAVCHDGVIISMTCNN